MKLKGFAIFVDDVEESADFYEGLLGKEPAKKDEKSAAFYMGRTRIFIHKKTAKKEGFPPGEDHVEYEVEDLEKEVERLKSNGFELEIEPKEYYWGKSAYLRDPEGRLIELTEENKYYV